MTKGAHNRVQEWSAHPYQTKAIDFVLTAFKREGAAALFLDPG